MPEITDLKIHKIAIVDRPANGEEFTIIKADRLQGESDRDAVWRELQAAFEKWIITPSIASDGRTREQRFAQFLTTSEGRKLHAAYNQASTDVPLSGQQPVEKSQPKTLEQYGFTKMDEIADRIAKSKGIDFYKAHDTAFRSNEAYQSIYELVRYPIAKEKMGANISKSRKDAIDLLKRKIDELAQ